MSDALQFIGIVLVGVLTGILSGMFGVGGAVISTPAVRALGATPLQAVGSTLPSCSGDPGTTAGTGGRSDRDAGSTGGSSGSGATASGGTAGSTGPGDGVGTGNRRRVP